MDNCTNLSYFSHKTKRELEESVKKYAIKNLCLADAVKPFIEFHDGTILYVEEVSGWIETHRGED